MNKLIAITFLLGGCVSQPLGTGPMGDASPPLVPPQPGVYDVTVATATGDCAPATLSGPLAPLQQLIDTDGQEGLRVQMPDVVVGHDALFATRELAGYHWQQSTTRCGAQVAYDVTAIETADDSLTLVRSELWSGIAAALTGADGTCDYVPARDCGSSVTIHYQLDLPCAAPCALAVSDAPAANGYPAVSCVCGAQ